jgi:DNA invertase Pin-like site-specific DNA recombinase
MIGAINEFERANLLERQKEGIAIAKRNGCYKGGKKGRNTAQFDEALYKELLVAYQHRKISKSTMAKRLGVSRPTLNKMMKSNLL